MAFRVHPDIPLDQGCAICLTNYGRVTCDSCGAYVCVFCIKAMSDTESQCTNCYTEYVKQFEPEDEYERRTR